MRMNIQPFEQVVKLIRSKGVGVYFITQNPLDIPDSVLSQLGNRVQHALRAYTPRDQKAVKTAADTFRQNPEFNTEEVITNLGLGEALVSFLDEKGIPGIVERAYIMPPKSKIGPASDEDMVKRYISMSYIGRKYETLVDRQSAYEMLTERAKVKTDANEKAEEKGNSGMGKGLLETLVGSGKSSKGQTSLDRFIKSAMSSMGTQVGRSLARGILGSLSK